MKFLRKLPITVALLATFFLVLLGVSYVRYIEYRDVYHSSKTLDKLTGQFEERQYLFAQLIESFVFGRNTLETIIYHPNPEEVNEARIKIREDHKNITSLLQGYRPMVADSTELAMYDSLFAGYKKIESDVNIALRFYTQNEVDKARDYDARVIQPAYANIQRLNFHMAEYVKERDFQKGDSLIRQMILAVAFSEKMTYVVAFFLLILSVIIFNAVRLIIRKRNQLAVSEKKYRDFIEETHELIARMDVQGKILFANNKLKSLLGYTDEELANLVVDDLVTSEFLAEIKNEFRDPVAIKTKRHIHGTIRCKNGENVFFEGSVIWDYKDKRLVNVTAFLNDVTERNILQKTLEKSEKRFRSLFDMAPIPMFTLDPVRLNFLQMNESALKFYGFEKEEIQDKTIMDIRLEEDIPRTASAIALIVEENWIYNDFYRHIKSDGTLADVEIFASRIEIHGGPLVLTIVNDVTEKRQNENTLTRAIIKTQEEERYIIGGELHDNVCQILATTKMSIEGMKSFLPGEAGEIYTLALDTVNLATTEIRNLSHRLAPVFCDEGYLKEAFEKLLETFNLAGKYKISFYFDEALVAHPLSLELQLNLYRIVQEQLRNIHNYALASEIRLKVYTENKEIWLSVSDNGVGFETDDFKDGIGIENMRRRAEFFSGTFKINSQPGHGCEVLVRIPIAHNLVKVDN